MSRTTTVELTDRDMLTIIEALADECSRNRMPMAGEYLAICGKMLRARRAAATPTEPDRVGERPVPFDHQEASDGIADYTHDPAGDI